MYNTLHKFLVLVNTSYCHRWYFISCTQCLYLCYCMHMISILCSAAADAVSSGNCMHMISILCSAAADAVSSGNWFTPFKVLTLNVTL